MYTVSDVSSVQVASLNEWVVIMYQGIDATGEDKQPVMNNSPIAAIFFVVFIFAGAYECS